MGFLFIHRAVGCAADRCAVFIYRRARRLRSAAFAPVWLSATVSFAAVACSFCLPRRREPSAVARFFYSYRRQSLRCVYLSPRALTVFRRPRACPPRRSCLPRAAPYFSGKKWEKTVGLTELPFRGELSTKAYQRWYDWLYIIISLYNNIII